MCAIIEFITLSDEERTELFDSKITVQELLDKYKQPDWCNYHEALSGVMGCWSLVSGKIKSIDNCKNCECLK